jgi:hypothetical protein
MFNSVENDGGRRTMDGDFHPSWRRAAACLTPLKMTADGGLWTASFFVVVCRRS